MSAQELSALTERQYAQKWKLTVEELLRAYNAGRRDFSRADLRNAMLDDVSLPGINLSDANLMMASLRRADLSGAVLTRANLHSADLTDTDLTEADLSHANVYDAGFKGATLDFAIRQGVDFSRAMRDETTSMLERPDPNSFNYSLRYPEGLWHRSPKDLLHSDLARVHIPDDMFIAQVWLPGMSRRNDYLRAYADGDGVLRVIAGRFEGAANEFRAKVIAQRGEDSLYLNALDSIEAAFSVWKAKQLQNAIVDYAGALAEREESWFLNDSGGDTNVSDYIGYDDFEDEDYYWI